LKTIYVPVEKWKSVPLGQWLNIRYVTGGQQVIKSEDYFFVGYVLFDKIYGFRGSNVVEKHRHYQGKNKR